MFLRFLVALPNQDVHQNQDHLLYVHSFYCILLHEFTLHRNLKKNLFQDFCFLILIPITVVLCQGVRSLGKFLCTILMMVNSHQFKSREWSNNKILSLVWSWVELPLEMQRRYSLRGDWHSCKGCPDARSNTRLRNFLLLLVLQTLFQSLNWFL